MTLNNPKQIDVLFNSKDFMSPLSFELYEELVKEYFKGFET